MAEINDLNVTDANNTARFPEGMLVKNVNNSARALEGILARWFKDQNGSVAAGGTADVITIAANQTLTAYYDGLLVAFEASGTNTGAVTINVDSLGAKSLKKQVTEDMEAGEIITGMKVIAVYDGTNFQMVSAFLDADVASSAAAAAASAAAALASENAAATSETNAATSETNAATSETNAATSASNASTSETNASTSASNASTSETNAANSAAAASTSETNAATSEANAAASAAAAQVAKIEWQGAYSGATAYALNDAVTYQGSSFICIQAGTGNTPAVGGTAYWDDLANKGDKGDQGDGDVSGPASATDNAIARFDTTTGKLLQNSAVTVDDSGNISGAGTYNTESIISGTSANQLVRLNGSAQLPAVDGSLLTGISAGAWAVKGSGSVSGVTEVSFTGITTKTTKIVLTDINGSGGDYELTYSSDDGSTYVSSNYYQRRVRAHLGNEAAVALTAQTKWTLTATTGSASDDTGDLVITIPDPSVATTDPYIEWSFTAIDSSTTSPQKHIGWGGNTAVSDIDAIKLTVASGTFRANYVVLELN